MNLDHLKNIIEATLMAIDEPRNINHLMALFDDDEDKPGKDEIRAVLHQLQEDYTDRGIELKEVASGFRFQVRTDYAIWVNRLFQDKPQRYSRAFMETLAIIAYRQPVTRSEIEDIRGVSVNTGIIKTMQEREWIRVVGHRVLGDQRRVVVAGSPDRQNWKCHSQGDDHRTHGHHCPPETGQSLNSTHVSPPCLHSIGRSES